MSTSEAAFDDADLNGFVDGRIEPGRAAALAEALALDPEARARIDGWKRQHEGLRTLFASVLFEPVPVRLIPPAPPRPAVPPPNPRPSPARARLVGALATAAFGTALAGFALGALASIGTDGFGLVPRAAAPADRGLVERALEAHRTYLSDAFRPVELTAAEEPRLLRWIQRRLGTPVGIPDLRDLGWTLAGGRILPGPDGPAALLVYGSGADRLGVMVGRGRAGEAPDDDGPVRAASWNDDAFGYALTTSRDAEWLRRNAPALRDSVQAQVRAGAWVGGAP